MDSIKIFLYCVFTGFMLYHLCIYIYYKVYKNNTGNYTEYQIGKQYVNDYAVVTITDIQNVDGIIRIVYIFNDEDDGAEYSLPVNIFSKIYSIK